MKISTKGIYAIEAMAELAMASDQNAKSIKSIAKRRGLSEKYLEQIAGALRSAGLIVSSRGASGGYFLKKEPENITVLEILQAAEKNLYPLDCLYKETDCGIDCEKCATRVFWNGLWNQIEEVIRKVTLKDLIDEALKEKPLPPDYSI